MKNSHLEHSPPGKGPEKTIKIEKILQNLNADILILTETNEFIKSRQGL